MSFNYSPKIVTEGLIFCLDFANQNCFVTGTTTCNDLSRTNTKGTLINSPTYSSTNKGNLLFNGTNQYIDLPPSGFSNNYLITAATNNFTIDLWCLPNLTHGIDPQSNTGNAGVSGQRYIVDPRNGGLVDAGVGISLGTNGLSVYEHGNSYMPALLVYTPPVGTSFNNKFTNFVVTYTNKQPRLYVNNVLVKTGLTSPRANVIFFIREVARGDYGYYGGRLAVARYYNRTLSTTEISRNYNTTKSRFGL